MSGKYVSRTARAIMGLVLLNVLYACSDSDEGKDADILTGSLEIISEMPTEIQTISTSGTGALSAYATIGSGTTSRIDMRIDSASGTASFRPTRMNEGPVTATITYEYTDDTGTLILATASRDLTVFAGSNSYTIAADDHDLASHDDDGDGVANAQELVEGRDPWGEDPVSCVLGVSTLDNCTLD